MSKIDRKDFDKSLAPIDTLPLEAAELYIKKARLSMELLSVSNELYRENPTDESVKALEEKAEEIKKGVNEFVLDVDKISQRKAKQTEKKK